MPVFQDVRKRRTVNGQKLFYSCADMLLFLPLGNITIIASLNKRSTMTGNLKICTAHTRNYNEHILFLYYFFNFAGSIARIFTVGPNVVFHSKMFIGIVPVDIGTWEEKLAHRPRILSQNGCNKVLNIHRVDSLRYTLICCDKICLTRLYHIKTKSGRGKTLSTTLNHAAVFSIFSIKIRYPWVGSLTETWVSAPMSLPSCMIGEPLTSVFYQGQQLLAKSEFIQFVFQPIHQVSHG